MLRTASTIRNITTKVPPYQISLIKKGVHYHADNSSVLTATHEQAQNNPVLQKYWAQKKVGVEAKTFQHPFIGKDTCAQTGCANKICPTPCAPAVTKEYVGHVTHANYPGSVHISYMDFNGHNREPFFLFYKIPIKNYDTEGKTIDTLKTAIMNQNNNALIMIHLNSSKESSGDEF